MIIDQPPAPVSERITMLGRRESCIYLVRGQTTWAVLGGGLTYILPDVLEQLDKLGIDEKKIKYWIIHHAHFDHVGLVPYFQKAWPWVQVVVSERGQEQLTRPQVMKTIVDLSRMVLAGKGLEDRAAEFGLDVTAITADLVPPDGSTLSLEDLTLNFMYTPGHSSCSMSVYIPEIKLLSASDGGGIPYGSNIFTAANSNFDHYQSSLEKLSRLEVEIYLSEHYGARTGGDARNYIPASMESARATRSLLEEVYLRTRDENQTVAEMTKLLAQRSQGYFLPPEVMEMVMGQMTRYIAKSLNNK